jgi:glutamate N-acetyltransferase/amino-acid N-acetyltransferase
MKLPKGFRSGAVAAGLKSSGALDLTIIQNQGPAFVGAAVFTSNKVVAAPVTWTKQVVADGIVSAVLLNSGGANACTGPRGFADTHKSAEYVAEKLGISSADVALCSTGLIGEFLPMEKILLGIDEIVPVLSEDNLEVTARAIMTTDSVPKMASSEKYRVTTSGIAKGAGMLAPSLATMLSVVMTDAVISESHLQEIFTRVCNRTFNRTDALPPMTQSFFSPLVPPLSSFQIQNLKRSSRMSAPHWQHNLFKMPKVIQRLYRLLFVTLPAKKMQ